MIDKAAVLEIAQKNASFVYRDLSVYEVRATLQDNQWFVDYEFKDKTLDGGGPHFVISAETGKILSYRFDQ